MLIEHRLIVLIGRIRHQIAVIVVLVYINDSRRRELGRSGEYPRAGWPRQWCGGGKFPALAQFHLIMAAFHIRYVVAYFPVYRGHHIAFEDSGEIEIARHCYIYRMIALGGDIGKVERFAVKGDPNIVRQLHRGLAGI